MSSSTGKLCESKRLSHVRSKEGEGEDHEVINELTPSFRRIGDTITIGPIESGDRYDNDGLA